MGRNKGLIFGIITLLAAALLLGGCIPAGETDGGTDILTLVIFLVLMFGLFYFLMVRPQRRRQKEHRQLLEELKRGDRVITAGGIYGVVDSISEDSIVIRVDSGATMRVAKGSVALRQE